MGGKKKKWQPQRFILIYFIQDMEVVAPTKKRKAGAAAAATAKKIKLAKIKLGMGRRSAYCILYRMTRNVSL